MTGFLWKLDPVVLSVAGFHLRWYGILFTGGLILAAHRGAPLARAAGVTEHDVDRLFAFIVVGVVIGARLGHVFFYEPSQYLADPITILEVWHGGLASHGGVIGLLVAVTLFAKRRTLPVLALLDAVAVVAPLAGAMIRLGNFANSEVYGRPSTLPWAVTFARVDLVPRHPTQLYEALTYALIGMLLSWMASSRATTRKPGWLLGWSLVLIFAARFGIEFLKELQVLAEANWPLDLGQLLSLPAIVAGAALIVRSRSSTTRL